jgi:prevent-host-death family protein
MVLYTQGMDVGIAELRAHLSDWLAQVRAGQEIVVTERGLPVARLVGLDSSPLLERLLDQGVIARPSQQRRPAATGRARPRPRQPLAERISEGRR